MSFFCLQEAASPAVVRADRRLEDFGRDRPAFEGARWHHFRAARDPSLHVASSPRLTFRQAFGLAVDEEDEQDGEERWSLTDVVLRLRVAFRRLEVLLGERNVDEFERLSKVVLAQSDCFQLAAECYLTVVYPESIRSNRLARMCFAQMQNKTDEFIARTANRIPDLKREYEVLVAREQVQAEAERLNAVLSFAADDDDDSNNGPEHLD